MFAIQRLFCNENNEISYQLQVFFIYFFFGGRVVAGGLEVGGGHGSELKFNSPVYTVKVMSSLSVYLTTLFLHRFSPLCGFIPVLVHISSPEIRSSLMPMYQNDGG